jgi:hypothetical protein
VILLSGLDDEYDGSFGSDYFDYYGEEERKADYKVIEAKTVIKDIFTNDPDKVFYRKQLEVFLEKSFFHWITAQAIKELVEEEFLLQEERLLYEPAGTKVSFIFSRKNRYYKRKIKKYLEIVKAYSNPSISSACGEQAEILFLNAFYRHGFRLISEDSNEFNGKKWEKTNHNLDFIIEKDNRVYGCEVKNTLAYIEKDELYIKLEICSYLQVHPLFIMRFAPKTYINEIFKNGGYALIFETQIYPLGHEALVTKIRETLGLPVICSKAIPEGIMNRFMKWHNSQNSCEF